MATQQTTIFNGSLSSDSENLSAQFTNGSGFYLIAPGSAFEYQVDIFLQVQLSNTITRMVRLNPMNVSNTERITLLPTSIIDLALPMRLSIVPSESFNLEVILLESDCSICTLNTKIDEILAVIENAQSSEFQDALIQFIIDNLLPLAVNALLPGISNLLNGVISNLLLPAIANAFPPGGNGQGNGQGNNIALTGSNINGNGGNNPNRNNFINNFT